MANITITRDNIISILQNGSVDIELPQQENFNNAELPVYFIKNNIQWKLDLSLANGFEQSLGIFYYNTITENWIEKDRIDI